ncbi:MAG: hypothetical protein MUF52_08280 [Syntrophobacteraceae bacterium]|jgi:XXXCH domain-containing protein|nr:hypothetical protein [Syntrophobacteraceae bacterium]
MSKKTATIHGREALADYLQNLTDQVRKGRFPFGPEVVELAEDLEVRLSLKEKKHSVACKLEWSRGAPEGQRAPGGRPEVPSPPGSFRHVKKDLARAFRAIKAAVSEGGTPDEGLLAEFEGLSRAFAARAEPEWERAAREYLGHMENLFRSLRDGRREAAMHEIQDLQARMVSCHRDYK